MRKIIINKSYTSNRSKPINYTPNDDYLFSHEYSKDIKKSFYKKKRSVYIKNLDLYKYKYFLSYYEHTKMKKYPLNLAIKNTLKNYIHSKPASDIEVTDKGTWGLDEKSFHYFHWFCDTLTRYIQVSKFNKEYPFLINSFLIKKDYIYETLNMLNINYKIYESDKLYKIKDLLISSHVADSGNFSYKNINELSTKLKEANASSEVKDPELKIWISRNKSKHRKILNEDELIPILNNSNFKIIYPEDLSFKDQIEIYKNTSVMGGLHGGALTNMLFMNKNTKLIELRRNGDSENNCYFTLASELKIKYYYLECKSLHQDLYISDIEVDLDKFENLINETND